MLRVHSTTDDIARLRVAAAPAPLWEITASFQLLADGGKSLVFGEWRGLVRPGLSSAGATLAGRTTGELAERFGISGPAVSQHTTVLRRAGLLRSIRCGECVVRTITPAGLTLPDSPLHTPVEA